MSAIVGIKIQLIFHANNKTDNYAVWTAVSGMIEASAFLFASLPQLCLIRYIFKLPIHNGYPNWNEYQEKTNTDLSFMEWKTETIREDSGVQMDQIGSTLDVGSTFDKSWLPNHQNEVNRNV